MSVIVEGRKVLHIAAPARIVEEGRELAWAETHIRKSPDMAWVLGNYVEADNANSNGHIFPLADLQETLPTIAHKPLNLLHRPHQIVGAFVASELLYPKAATAAEDEEGPTVLCAKCGERRPTTKASCPNCGETEVVPNDDDGIGDAEKQMAALDTHPHVEALAGLWKYYFPDVFDMVEAAYKDGALAYSMECVPETVGCVDGCGPFPYMGRTDESYCDHLNEKGSRKKLYKPRFTAGALIIPPVRPGWKHADVKELSKLIEEDIEAAERTYDEFSNSMPHLSPREWESLMQMVLVAAAR